MGLDMNISSGLRYPYVRPRRLRRNRVIRDMVSETSLTIRSLITPIFIDEGIREPIEIGSMPGYFRYPLVKITDYVSRLFDLGLDKFILFGIPRHKDTIGSQAYDDNGVIQRALRDLKGVFGDRITIFTDVCLCEYTSHGHCGVLVGGEDEVVIDNDKTLELLGRIALSHAENGADFVAPSAMMDGMVAAIRSTLDREGYKDTGILSYSIKYSSIFYTPFREAAESAPRMGDRASYQMDVRNKYEALKEAYLDIVEGADILMVKPALPYLDVIQLVKENVPWMPLAAYNVSGEYSMVKSFVEATGIDGLRVISEVLNSIKRAGADIIITYHAIELAERLSNGDRI